MVEGSKRKNGTGEQRPHMGERVILKNPGEGENEQTKFGLVIKRTGCQIKEGPKDGL